MLLSPGKDQHFTCKNLEDTQKIAETFARTLSPGDVVAMQGELGAGKTTMIRMIVRALGYHGVVTSPTFTLMNIYATDAVDIYHFDFYRIHNENEAYGIGADEYFESGSIVFIEWPEKVRGLLPDNYFEIRIRIPDFSASPSMRDISIRNRKS
ncbi:MAG: tRNA (adenosine(37)-N6)-threonylcarbamoyltransferase complex ATPase subunit type 1 TsaE [bacterium]